MRALFCLIAVLGLGACVAPPTMRPQVADPGVLSMDEAVAVSRRVEQVAESVCRDDASLGNCDFMILLDRDPRNGINAFQTVDPATGRPVVILTSGLVDAVRNADELAFVIGHETAHHIAGHLEAQRAAAEAGARIFGTGAQGRGASPDEVLLAANLGALLGARQFSQGAELEADVLGTLIACRAGFDARRGARFFGQLPDPGMQFLGTHPPNAARMRAVAEAAVRVC